MLSILGGAEQILREARQLQQQQGNPARTDPLRFIEAAGLDDKGRAIAINSYTRLLALSMEECQQAGVHFSHLSPPGLGKSTVAGWHFLRRIGLDNHLRTVVISAVEEASEDRVSLCRQTLMSSQFAAVFPEATPDFGRSHTADGRGWRKDSWFLRAVGQRKDPTMCAVAMTTLREDLRVDMLLADDIITEAMVDSPVLMARTKKAFWAKWIEGRLSNGGWCCYLQNARSRDDLAHNLRTSPAFCSLWVGITAGGLGDELFVQLWNPPPGLSLVERPEEFGAQEVDPTPALRPGETPAREYRMAKPALDSLSAAAMAKREPLARRRLYGLQTRQEGEIMFPAWNGRRVEPGTVAQVLRLKREIAGLPTMDYLERMRFRIFGGIDLSSLKRRGTVFWLVAMDREYRVFPLMLKVGRFSDLELVDVIDSAWKLGLEFESVQFENNSLQDRAQNTVVQEAQRRQLPWWGRLSAFMTGENKAHPENGLPAINTMIAGGQIVWVGGESSRDKERFPHAADWLAFETEMAELPAEIGRATTPDTIMAFWMALTTALACPAPSEAPPEGAAGESAVRELEGF